MSSVRLFHSTKKINATISLGGSKSISNRILLIRALCDIKFKIENLSTSDDTQTLDKLLSENSNHYDAGHAGTTFRFLTAFLAFKEGSQYLTGSERMQNRPIKALVDALIKIGANIEYEKEEGYPPLIIHSPSSEIKKEVNIRSNISSQYISALLMMAPTLPQGLTLNLECEIVSLPYLKMTLAILSEFGIEYFFENNSILIKPQTYQSKDYFVESDWSAASYYYSMAAIAEEAEIVLKGLNNNSLQGDAKMAEIAEKFGIKTEYGDKAISIHKIKNHTNPELFEYDFIEQPDIAQTVFAMCGALNTKGLFTGLQTLYIKETNRIQACKNELAKIGISLSKLPAAFSKNSSKEYFLLEGNINFNEMPHFDTYHDHRMAMSLASLALLHEITINDYEVVSKSYPEFWDDLKKCNFDVEIH